MAQQHAHRRPSTTHGRWRRAAARAAKPRGHGRNGAQAYERRAHRRVRACPICNRATAARSASTGKVYDSPPRTHRQGDRPGAAGGHRLQARSGCAAGCATRSSPPPLPAAVAALPQVRRELREHDRRAALRQRDAVLPARRAAARRCTCRCPTRRSGTSSPRPCPAPRAAFEELIRQAAQAPLLHSDDTPMKVLSLMAERAKAEAAGEQARGQGDQHLGHRRRLQAEQQHKVVLFFTGHAHAGKNMQRVLAHRAQELPPPMQMCDALAGQHRRRVRHHPVQLPGPRAHARWSTSSSTSPRPRAT